MALTLDGAARAKTGSRVNNPRVSPSRHDTRTGTFRDYSDRRQSENGGRGHGDPDPGSRPETHTITPHIVVQNAADAAEWYTEVFGASERGRLEVPDGRLMQVELRFGDSPVMLSDEFPEMGVVSPLSVGGTATVLHFKADDANATWERAVAGGAEIRQPLQRRSGESCTGRSPIHSATGGESRSTSARCRPKSLSAQLPTHSAAADGGARHAGGRTACLEFGRASSVTFTPAIRPLTESRASDRLPEAVNESRDRRHRSEDQAKDLVRWLVSADERDAT